MKVYIYVIERKNVIEVTEEVSSLEYYGKNSMINFKEFENSFGGCMFCTSINNVSFFSKQCSFLKKLSEKQKNKLLRKIWKMVE